MWLLSVDGVISLGGFSFVDRYPTLTSMAGVKEEC